LSRLRLNHVAGLDHVEWENPRINTGDYWLIALGNTESSKPRMFRLGYTGNFAEIEQVPFSSAIATRYNKIQNERKRRVARVVTEAIALSLTGALVISVLLGFLQFRTVMSGSMSGTFEVGDVLVAVNPQLAAPEVGSM